MKLSTIVLLSLILAPKLWAQTPGLGSQIPPFTIDNLGALVLEGEEVSHQPWSLETVRGKPTYLQHLAARIGVDETYKPLSDAIENSLDVEAFHSVAIVNRDDAAFGTGFVVTATLKSNKRRYPDANIVVDSKGKMLDSWDLQPKSAAVMILDAEGVLLYFKEGPLTEAEQEEVLNILASAIESAGQERDS